jgi:hypothetical protein
MIRRELCKVLLRLVLYWDILLTKELNISLIRGKGSVVDKKRLLRLCVIGRHHPNVDGFLAIKFIYNKFICRMVPSISM